MYFVFSQIVLLKQFYLVVLNI